MIIEKTLKSMVLSDNHFKNRLGRAFKRYKGYKTMWEREIFFNFPKQDTRPTQKVRVTITRIYGKRKRPFDRINYASGCKPILDQLKKQNYIFDDSPKWIDDFYEQERGEVEG